MKNWLAIILLLITSTGNFIPCCRVDNCCADQVHSTSASQKNQKEEGTCSPFISCATCTSFVVMAKAIQIVKPVDDKQVHYERVLVFDLSTYSSMYWQPPKFC